MIFKTTTLLSRGIFISFLKFHNLYVMFLGSIVNENYNN